MKKIFNVIGICATVVLCVCIVSCDSGYYSFDDGITTKTENHEIQEDTIITDIAYSLFDDSISLPVKVIFTYGTNYNHDYFKFDPAYKDTIKQCMFEQSEKLSEYGNFLIDWDNVHEGANIKDLIYNCTVKDSIWYFVSAFHTLNEKDVKLIKYIQFGENSEYPYFIFSANTSYLIDDDGIMRFSNWY